MDTFRCSSCFAYKSIDLLFGKTPSGKCVCKSCNDNYMRKNNKNNKSVKNGKCHQERMKKEYKNDGVYNLFNELRIIDKPS